MFLPQSRQTLAETCWHALANGLVPVVTDDTPRDLLSFVRGVSPWYKADPFHQYLADIFNQVSQGVLRRVILSTPPQHGKSSLASQHYPAFHLTHHPDDDIILCSYTLDLAAEQSEHARQIVSGEAFQRLYPHIRLRRDRKSVTRWKLDQHRGGLRAAGVGGGISGYPARLGIIDDPFKDWEDAQSQTMRERAWNWYNSTFYSRIAEDGAIIVIGTRWHEDDLIGRLIQREADEWLVIRLPALAEPQEERDANNRYLGLRTGEPDPIGRAAGEALSPSRYSREYLERVKEKSPRVFASLYQGVPRPTEGNLIKRQWLQLISAAPSDADIRTRIRYWDNAGTSTGTGARTAGVKLALAKDGRIFVEHAIAGYWNAGERKRVQRQIAELDGRGTRIYIEQEPGSAGVESVKAAITNLEGFSAYADRPTGDKDTRLEPFAAQAEAGNVYLLKGEWNMDYIEEMIAIPSGARRDQGDATSGAYNMAVKRGQAFQASVVTSSGIHVIGEAS